MSKLYGLCLVGSLLAGSGVALAAPVTTTTSVIPPKLVAPTTAKPTIQAPAKLNCYTSWIAPDTMEVMIRNDGGAGSPANTSVTWKIGGFVSTSTLPALPSGVGHDVLYAPGFGQATLHPPPPCSIQ